MSMVFLNHSNHSTVRRVGRCAGLLGLSLCMSVLTACDTEDLNRSSTQTGQEVQIAVNQTAPDTTSDAGVPMGVGVHIQPDTPQASESNDAPRNPSLGQN
jgi:hypothetical protein